MSIITFSDVSFHYDGSYEFIFEHVSLQLDTDWKLGLTGRNGRGKTTLLRMLAGELEYTGRIASSTAFDYFPFPVEDENQLVSELFETISPQAMAWEVCRELNLLGVEDEVLWRPFSTLSNGERTKVLLAGLFLKENNFLLIDEPTNHLDSAGRALLSRYLSRKQGFLLVSHDRDFLDGCVDHILSINKTDLELQKGNFTTWQQNRERQDQFEEATQQKLRREAASLNAAAKRGEGWSNQLEKTKYHTTNSGLRVDRGYIGHKSAKLMKRAKSIEMRRVKAAEDASGLLKNLERAEPLKLHPLSYPKPLLLEAKGLVIRYGEKTAVENVSFTVSRGERIALTGPNGSGKSSILGLIAGKPMDISGLFSIGNGMSLSYLPQDSSFLQGDLTSFAEKEGLEESLFKAILRKLDFSREQFGKAMGSFSAGQKKKVLLARSLCQSAHLYLWDEPLNYIDVLSRIQVEQLLLEFKPTILFVEHDAAFCRTVATKEIRLTGSRTE